MAAKEPLGCPQLSIILERTVIFGGLFMVRGMFEESQTLSDLAQQETDFFRFLGNLLAMEEEGLLTFTQVGEHVILKSVVSFLEMLTPAEIQSFQSGDFNMERRFPASRYANFAEYSALLQLLGLDSPGDEPMAESLVVVPWDEPDTEAPLLALPAESNPVDSLPPAPTQEYELAVVTTLENCLEKGKHYLSEGWPGMARDRFEEALRLEPRSLLAKAYLAWMDFIKSPRAKDLRQQVDHALDRALSVFSDDADMLTFRGMLLKLDGNLPEAERLLRKAISGKPGHALAQCQLRVLARGKKKDEEWPSIDYRSIRMDAPIIIQRRVHGQTKTYSFKEPEIRIGSSDQDHIVVSASTLPHLAKRHCLVIFRGGRHFVRRVASLGRVWINGREIDVRKDEPVLPDDCIRLGQTQQGPALEFRVFDVKGMALPSYSLEKV